MATSSNANALRKDQFTAAALKRSQFFCQKPATLNANVGASAQLLGLSKQQFTAAALKHPQLFYQRPETLNANVAASAHLLGLSKEQFVAAALNQPSLFCMKPETLNGKKPYILQISESLGEVRDFASLFQSIPNAITRSKSSLHARYVLAKLDPKRGAFGTLVKLPAAEVTFLIVRHFTDQIARTGKGTRALQVMHAQGLITALPPNIPAIPRPPRRVRHLVA